ARSASACLFSSLGLNSNSFAMLLSSSTLFVFVFFCGRQQRVGSPAPQPLLGLRLYDAYVVRQRLLSVSQRLRL
ncbi:Transcriptional regulator XRE family, partial [Dysosmobacter welbionis]